MDGQDGINTARLMNEYMQAYAGVCACVCASRVSGGTCSKKCGVRGAHYLLLYTFPVHLPRAKPKDTT